MSFLQQELNQKKDPNICKYYLEKGSCQYGNQCWFKHPLVTESTSRINIYNHEFMKGNNFQPEYQSIKSKKICKFYLNNCCKFGHQCYNLHNYESRAIAKDIEVRVNQYSSAINNNNSLSDNNRDMDNLTRNQYFDKNLGSILHLLNEPELFL
ncbi:hypothetical protein K502DRAFT_368305 [Neoconidiobolus thromboides FSU 785]|nr:hypothetical protein K502DRAFT_368305 [Neoconidiobolus thromboides FSU 785]